MTFLFQPLSLDFTKLSLDIFPWNLITKKKVLAWVALSKGLNSLTGLVMKTSLIFMRNLTTCFLDPAQKYSVFCTTKVLFVSSYISMFFYPPSSRISSCVRTVDRVMCLHSWHSPAVQLQGGLMIGGLYPDLVEGFIKFTHISKDTSSFTYNTILQYDCFQ